MKYLIKLSIELAKVDFKLKNEGSYLGIFWYLLNPLLMFILLLAVFSTRLGQNIPLYFAYLLLGVIMFNFFRQVTVESTRVIDENKWIIKSINFPLEALIVAIVLKTLFSHLLEIILVLILLLVFGLPVTGVVFYPFILVLLCLFTAGIALILSALTVYFIDLEHIWNFASLLLWLGTPIFYAIEGQRRLLICNLFNPMYYFITIARDLIIYAQTPKAWMCAGALAYSLLFLAIGLSVFGKLKRRFAELI